MWLVAGWDPGHKRDGGEILADVWALDLSTWAWRQVQPQVRNAHHTSRVLVMFTCLACA